MKERFSWNLRKLCRSLMLGVVMICLSAGSASVFAQEDGRDVPHESATKSEPQEKPASIPWDNPKCFSVTMSSSSNNNRVIYYLHSVRNSAGEVFDLAKESWKEHSWATDDSVRNIVREELGTHM